MTIDRKKFYKRYTGAPARLFDPDWNRIRPEDYFPKIDIDFAEINDIDPEAEVFFINPEARDYVLELAATNKNMAAKIAQELWDLNVLDEMTGEFLSEKLKMPRVGRTGEGLFDYQLIMPVHKDFSFESHFSVPPEISIAAQFRDAALNTAALKYVMLHEWRHACRWNNFGEEYARCEADADSYALKKMKVLNIEPDIEKAVLALRSHHFAFSLSPLDFVMGAKGEHEMALMLDAELRGDEPVSEGDNLAACWALKNYLVSQGFKDFSMIFTAEEAAGKDPVTDNYEVYQFLKRQGNSDYQDVFDWSDQIAGTNPELTDYEMDIVNPSEPVDYEPGSLRSIRVAELARKRAALLVQGYEYVVGNKPVMP